MAKIKATVSVIYQVLEEQFSFAMSKLYLWYKGQVVTILSLIQEYILSAVWFWDLVETKK